MSTGALELPLGGVRECLLLEEDAGTQMRRAPPVEFLMISKLFELDDRCRRDHPCGERPCDRSK